MIRWMKQKQKIFILQIDLFHIPSTSNIWDFTSLITFITTMILMQDLQQHQRQWELERMFGTVHTWIYTTNNKYYSSMPYQSTYLLLWGCETWSLVRQTLLDKLEVFLHRSVRHIISIKISQVKEETRGTVLPREDLPGECCFLLFMN